jgi:hypothetical protein
MHGLTRGFTVGRSMPRVNLVHAHTCTGLLTCDLSSSISVHNFIIQLFRWKLYDETPPLSS